MKAESKISRLVLASPWFLLIFLIIPVTVIITITMRLHIPLLGPRLLLYNNAVFALLIACRFVRYLSGLRQGIRYGAAGGAGDAGEVVSLSCQDSRATLERQGYTFDGSGAYCEKRDLGYLGTTLFYGGLMVLLLVGTLDNMRQFSGTLYDGVGTSTKLSKLENYRLLNRGPLAVDTDSLPQMRIMSQVTPNEQYPQGATETLLLAPDGKEYKALLKPGEPYSYGDYDIYMAKLIFEPQVVIKTDKGQTVISKFVKLHPMVEKLGGFSFFGTFAQANLTGDVYYQPERSRLKVIMRRDGKRVMDAELIFQGERLVGQADLVLTCEKMGQWSEIRVVRKRHMPLLALGGVLALLGLLMRIAIKSQRVWLEELPQGCRVRTGDREALGLLSGAETR